MDRILKNREVKNGIIVPFEVDMNGKTPIRVTDDYIEISYRSLETPSKVLSNLSPYRFNFLGYEIQSIEALIQSLKYEDKDIREDCYNYWGIDAWNLRGLKPYDWQKEGILYTPLGKIDRFCDEYQEFLNELSFSVFQNARYKKNLKDSEDKKLDHIIDGEDDIHRTTYSRSEYISRLYALRYCAQNELTQYKDVIKTLRRVQEELNA